MCYLTESSKYLSVIVITDQVDPSEVEDSEDVVCSWHANFMT